MQAKTATAKERSARLQRANWEAFEFRVPVQGRARVENTSYGDESDNHVYVVTIEDGSTVECTCPSDKYQPGKCKHRIAVENQPAVLKAAGESQ